GAILRAVNSDNVSKLKPALLSLVRGLRIASASFSAFRDREAKRRGALLHDTANRSRSQSMSEEKDAYSDVESDDEKETTSRTNQSMLAGQQQRMNLTSI